MSKLLHGEMKCTAPAHLLSKHQQRDISCSALQKKGKSKAAFEFVEAGLREHIL
jgi:hypothetical protein